MYRVCQQRSLGAWIDVQRRFGSRCLASGGKRPDPQNSDLDKETVEWSVLRGMISLLCILVV